MMNFLGIDHLVLTVTSVDQSLHFYCTVLEMPEITFKKNRKAILCGNQKINLHEVGKEFKPHAKYPHPGSADLCLITDTPLDQVEQHLTRHKVAVCEGPIQRTGARGDILSIYVRDPDQNLIEISNYL